MLGPRLLQRQVQKLVMTPQMQQAIQLLQLQTMELAQLIEQEMEQNPLLEQVEVEEEETAPESSVPDGIPATKVIEPDRNEGSDETERLDTADMKAIEEINWDEFFPDDRNWENVGQVEQYGEDKRGYLANLSNRGQSLQEYLMQQVGFTDFTETERQIAEAIIGNIDIDGYLNTGIDEIIQSLQQQEQAENPMYKGREMQDSITEKGNEKSPTTLPIDDTDMVANKQTTVIHSTAPPMKVEEAEKVLARIQAFDPPGVAARNLQECLLLQLPAKQITDPIVKEILASYFHELERHKFPQLAKQLGVSLNRIQEAVDTIAQLEPKPGRQFNTMAAQTVIPDVIVEKVDGEYLVSLNDEGLPRLRISPSYQAMLKNKNALSAEQYQFVLDKFRAAKNLIRNIERRQRTILMVTESIVKMQQDFFDKGLEYLKPLKLREIAELVGVHESTVARVTTNKYVQTPHGIFELKYFFSSGVENIDGDSVSARSLRQMIATLVQGEDPEKPLSDQKLADILNAKGIHIARRTVAKYREQVKILPAHLRRRMNYSQ